MKTLREMIDIVEGADPTQADIKSVAEWMDTTPNNLNIEIVNEPIQKFIQQIKEMYGPQMKKELGSISRDLRFVASAK